MHRYKTGSYARRQLVVVGSKKAVELKPWKYRSTLTEFFTDTTEYTSNAVTERGQTTACEKYDRYSAMLHAFAEVAADEKGTPCSCNYELSLYKTLLQCCGVPVEEANH